MRIPAPASLCTLKHLSKRYHTCFPLYLGPTETDTACTWVAPWSTRTGTDTHGRIHTRIKHYTHVLSVQTSTAHVPQMVKAPQCTLIAMYQSARYVHVDISSSAESTPVTKFLTLSQLSVNINIHQSYWLLFGIFKGKGAFIKKTVRPVIS